MHCPQMIEWVQTFRFRKAGKEKNGTPAACREQRIDKIVQRLKTGKRKGLREMYQVAKRDGKIAEFNLTKISEAIRKAFEAQEKNYN